MPAAIARIFIAGKSHGETAQAATGYPTPLAYQLIKGGMQSWGVGSFRKGRVGIIAQANNRTCPRGLVIRIAPGVAP